MKFSWRNSPDVSNAQFDRKVTKVKVHNSLTAKAVLRKQNKDCHSTIQQPDVDLSDQSLPMGTIFNIA